jgi:hypothetical protein
VKHLSLSSLVFLVPSAFSWPVSGTKVELLLSSREAEVVKESSVKTPSKLAERRKTGVSNLFLAPSDRNLDEAPWLSRVSFTLELFENKLAERPDAFFWGFSTFPFVADEGSDDL